MADRRPCRSVSWPAVSVKLEQGVPHADDVTRGPRQRQLRFRPTVCKTLVEAAAVTSEENTTEGSAFAGHSAASTVQVPIKAPRCHSETAVVGLETSWGGARDGCSRSHANLHRCGTSSGAHRVRSDGGRGR
jgi:hypothetical protein